MLNTQVDAYRGYMNCGIEYNVETSLYFHFLRIKFTDAIQSCDYIQLGAFSITGTIIDEVFTPPIIIKDTCIVKRRLHSNIIPLIYLFAIS